MNTKIKSRSAKDTPGYIFQTIRDFARKLEAVRVSQVSSLPEMFLSLHVRSNGHVKIRLNECSEKHVYRFDITDWTDNLDSVPVKIADVDVVNAAEIKRCRKEQLKGRVYIIDSIDF